MNTNKLFGLICCSAFIFSLSIEVGSGVLYENIVKDNPKQSIHVAKIDPSKAAISIEVAHGKCKSTETATEMAKRKNAIVAINAGYFDFGQKNKIRNLLIQFFDCFGYNKSYTFPVFALKIKGKNYSLSNVRAGFIGWDKNGKAVLDATKLTWQLQVGNKLHPIADLNKPYAYGPILYNPVYDERTQRKDRTTEVVVEDGKIIRVIKNGVGGTKIPKDGFVYAIDHKHLKGFNLNDFKIGQPASIVESYSDDKYDWKQFAYMLGSTPLILKDNQITDTVLKGKSHFFTKSHPRTAVGILEDGRWALVVVDGRQKHSKGMTMLELVHLMQELGCKDALNLDGGGSSIMVVQNKAVNKTSGREWGLSKKERNLSNSILILPKK